MTEEEEIMSERGKMQENGLVEQPMKRVSAARQSSTCVGGEKKTIRGETGQFIPRAPKKDSSQVKKHAHNGRLET